MLRPHAHCWSAAVLAAALCVNGCSSAARAQATAGTSGSGKPAASAKEKDAPPAPTPSPAAQPAPATAAAPTRPTAVLWPTTRLFNVDRIDVRAIASRYGLVASWSVRDKVMQLSDSSGVRMRFEDRRSDFQLDGTRVFLGEKIVLYKDSLYVGKIDVIKTVAPLMRPADYAAHLPASPKLIVLDPGHGGNDPGTQNAALRLVEKDLTFDVVQRLRKLLEARGFAVRLTRDDDRRVELESRPGFANDARADLFVSVHFNNADASVAGVEVYALTPQQQVSTQPEQDKTMVATAYPGNRQDFGNALLAFNFQHALCTGLKASDRGFKRRRVAVLRFPECPAALVEAGFLSNDTEARRIATPEYRQKIAEALAAGIAAYSSALPPQTQQ